MIRIQLKVDLVLSLRNDLNNQGLHFVWVHWLFHSLLYEKTNSTFIFSSPEPKAHRVSL